MGLVGESGIERLHITNRDPSPLIAICAHVPAVVEYLRLCLPYSRIVQPAMSLFDQIYIFVINFIYSLIEHSY